MLYERAVEFIFVSVGCGIFLCEWNVFVWVEFFCVRWSFLLTWVGGIFF